MPNSLNSHRTSSITTSPINIPANFSILPKSQNFIIDVAYESGDIIDYYITNCPRNIQDDLLQRINIFAIAIMTLINRVNMDYIFLAGDAKISLMEFALKYSKKTHVDWNTTLIQILRIIMTQDERKVVFE